MRPAGVSGQIFLDQTEIFPRVSIRGNRSIMVLYDYDSNAILNKPFKNNTTPYFVRSQMRLIQYLLDWGLNPSALRIYNECLEALKSFFRANSVDFQLCPPSDHRTNQA